LIPVESGTLAAKSASTASARLAGTYPRARRAALRGLRVAVADGKGDRTLGGHEETAARFALTMRC
jgi:hypothetical protein